MSNLNEVSNLINKGYKCVLFGVSIYMINELYENINYILNNINDNSLILGFMEEYSLNIFNKYCKKSRGFITCNLITLNTSPNHYYYSNMIPPLNKFYMKNLYEINHRKNNIVGINIELSSKKNFLFYKSMISNLSTYDNIYVFQNYLDFFNSDEFMSIDIKIRNKMVIFNLNEKYTNNNFYNYLLKYCDCDIFIGEDINSIIISTSLYIPTIVITCGEDTLGSRYMKTIGLEKYIVNDFSNFIEKLSYIKLNIGDISKYLTGVSMYIKNIQTTVKNYIINTDNIDYQKIKNKLCIKDLIGKSNKELELKLKIDFKQDTYYKFTIPVGNELRNMIPQNYVNASKYIISLYETKSFVENIGYPTGLNELIKSNRIINLDYSIKNDNNLNLSSYLIKLNNGYSYQEWKPNGYSGYNMFVDSNGDMLYNYLNSFGPCCWTWHHLRWNICNLRKFNKNDVPYFSGKIVCLLSNNNYGHWFHDIIAALHLIEKENIGYHKIYLNSFKKTEYIMACLYHLGYKDIDIIQADDHPVIQCEELYLPVQQPRQVLWMKEWIRKKFINISPELQYKKEKRYIYIGRNLDKHRRIINESEIMKMLKKYNFEYIPTIRNLTFAETVKLFRNSKCIIMSHGANCMNTHWCSQGTTVIYITNNKLKKFHGYFKECYTNKYINFIEFIAEYIYDKKIINHDQFDMKVNVKNLEKKLVINNFKLI